MTMELKLAVLIDADNIPYANIKGMLEEIAKYGTPTFKRIYGDWTRPSLSGWKGVLLENAITPIQQYSYTKGKNSTDSALIIDAMDILYAGQVDGFCIISSDSDFTRLATRLRESGKKVFGMGEKKTPISFIASCNKFIYLEILPSEVRPTRAVKSATRVTRNRPVKKQRVDEVSSESGSQLEQVANVPDSAALARNSAPRIASLKSNEEQEDQLAPRPPRNVVTAADLRKGKLNKVAAVAPEADEPTPVVEDSQSTPVVVSPINDDVIRLISDSITALAEEDGWVGLSTLGALIMKRQPDFDSRNYGFKKLIELVKNIPQIEIDKRETGKNNVSHFYVRLRETAVM